jgi:hypothetical protein
MNLRQNKTIMKNKSIVCVSAEGGAKANVDFKEETVATAVANQQT